MKGSDSERRRTLGEQLKCMPGTGSVVTYIVIHRYRYSVPTMQKNLLLIIDLENGKTGHSVTKLRRFISVLLTRPNQPTPELPEGLI